MTDHATTPHPPRTWPRRIDPAWTVNDALRHHPAVARVFDEYGIDTCCGGARPLDAAAHDAGVDPAALLEALEYAACPCGGRDGCARWAGAR